MCNARNHPPGCQCGWGLGLHNGGYGSGSGRHRSATVRSGASSPVQSQWHHTQVVAFNGLRPGSFVNPNAKCPVCGCSVHFYASADGGRVYFDEIGPPWPKHPCTDNSGEIGVRGGVQSSIDERAWVPLGNVKVCLVGANGLHHLDGSTEHHGARPIYFRLEGSFEVEMAQLSESGAGALTLSLLARDESKREWSVYEGPASYSRDAVSADALCTLASFPDCLPDDELASLAGRIPRIAIDKLNVADARAKLAELESRIQSLLSEIAVLTEERDHLLSVCEHKVTDTGR